MFFKLSRILYIPIYTLTARLHGKCNYNNKDTNTIQDFITSYNTYKKNIHNKICGQISPFKMIWVHLVFWNIHCGTFQPVKIMLQSPFMMRYSGNYSRRKNNCHIKYSPRTPRDFILLGSYSCERYGSILVSMDKD